MSQYFPKLYKNFRGNVKVKLDLSSYATKLDLKDARGIDKSKLKAKYNLVNLKAEVDKIDVDKLKTVHVDLSRLSNEFKWSCQKKTVYYKLVTKVNNIDTRGFVLKAKYDTNKSD